MASQSLLSLACVGLLMSSGALLMTTTMAEAAKARSAKSIECSKQADAKGLRGKTRKSFRSKCLRDKTV